MRHTCLTVVCFLALLGAGLAAADVLVTTDGTVVETKGPWQQRGKMVVFTLENGQLSALRATDVDFEATARWTEELAATAPPQAKAAAPSPRTARLVLTDADVKRGQPILESEPEASGDEPADADPSADPTADPAEQSSVRVTTWDQEEPADGRGRRVFGTVRNDGNSYATDITIEATVYDNDGGIAGTSNTTPASTSLRPGESTTFSVQFPDVYIVGAARLRVKSLDFEIDGREESTGGADEVGDS